MSDLSSTTTIVVGASRGPGRGIAVALAAAGAPVTTVFPHFSPQTGVGEPAALAYASRAGQGVEAFLQQQPRLVTPEVAGAIAVELVGADAAPAYRLSGEGLQQLH